MFKTLKEIFPFPKIFFIHCCSSESTNGVDFISVSYLHALGRPFKTDKKQSYQLQNKLQKPPTFGAVLVAECSSSW